MKSITPEQAVKLVAERVGWTFAQNFVVILLATGSAGLYDHETWMRALLVAAWASLFALITTTVTVMADFHPVGQVAVLYRAAITALQTFIAALPTSGLSSFADAGALAALATALSTAFLAALKSLVGLANPNTIGDSTAVSKAAPTKTGVDYRFPGPDQDPVA